VDGPLDTVLKVSPCWTDRLFDRSGDIAAIGFVSVMHEAGELCCRRVSLALQDVRHEQGMLGDRIVPLAVAHEPADVCERVCDVRETNRVREHAGRETRGVEKLA
jgi:hypothetical protein